MSLRIIIPFFVLLPLAELYLLLWLAKQIGFWETVAVALLTGIAGGFLAKREGARVWRAWQQSLNQLQAPADGLLSGALVLFGGALLLTPGIITDGIGFALLLPFSRSAIVRWLRPRVQRYIDQRTAVVSVPGRGRRRSDPYPQRSDIEVPGESNDSE